jgi:hypothetical protein
MSFYTADARIHRREQTAGGSGHPRGGRGRGQPGLV